jgi:type VI secretion system protein
MRASLVRIGLAPCLLVLTACGLVTTTLRMFGGSLPLEVTIAGSANQESPVAVELLIIYDKRLLDRLLALGAREWFEQREQWKRDFPGDFESWAWEWVPGQPVGRQEKEFRAGAKGALVFADYLTPGAHRAQFDPHSPVRLLLGEATLTVEPLAE